VRGQQRIVEDEAGVVESELEASLVVEAEVLPGVDAAEARRLAGGAEARERADHVG
jgi:hypothetical protein